MPGARMNSELAKFTAASSRPISRVEKPMKLTICETVAWPCRCSSAPATTMVMTASVLEARVSTVTRAHQFSTGNWWRITFSTISPNARASACSRPNDCTATTLESASCARPASAECAASAWRCPVWVRRMTNRVTVANTQTRATSTSDKRQFRNALSGSKTSTAM